MFREEFLPHYYLLELRWKLELHTQTPEETLFKYVPAMQEWYKYAKPKGLNAERVACIIKHSHPTFTLNRRACNRRNLPKRACNR